MSERHDRASHRSVRDEEEAPRGLEEAEQLKSSDLDVGDELLERLGLWIDPWAGWY